MGLQDVLMGYKPVENEDSSGFPVIKGSYKCAVTRLALGEVKNDPEPKRKRYELELTVNSVLDGDDAIGRKLWRNYLKDDDEAVKKLLNDLFTMGLNLPRENEAQFENSFFIALDHDATVRAWGWKPEKAKDGTPIPPEEQVPQQMFKIVNAKKVKAAAKKTSDIPF